MALHAQVTQLELQDWILEEIRRRPDHRGFAAAVRQAQRAFDLID